mgnify:CR=1 FL=1|tara:strand:+ start:2611 stop:3048 length:438 start_codon:yes stop_codon:yes gene_type:complete
MNKLREIIKKELSNLITESYPPIEHFTDNEVSNATPVRFGEIVKVLSVEMTNRQKYYGEIIDDELICAINGKIYKISYFATQYGMRAILNKDVEGLFVEVYCEGKSTYVWKLHVDSYNTDPINRDKPEVELNLTLKFVDGESVTN